jgi:1,4-dihydroxy-2-naphthoate octaprenyltransferase
MALLLSRWRQAVYTIPRDDLSAVDPVTRWLVLARTPVVIMTLSSAVIGSLLALRDHSVEAHLLLLTGAGLVIAHAASNLVNDFWDFRRGADTESSPRVSYGPHPFASGAVSGRSVLVVTVGLLAAATAIGVYLTAARGLGVLAFALPGAAILLLYSGGPLPLKYVGLGELAVLLVWGPLMTGGTYYVATGELPSWVLLASLPYAFGVTTVVMGKHIDKLPFDSEHQIRTLPVWLGEAAGRWTTRAVFVLSYASVLAVAVWQAMPGLLLPLVAVPTLGAVLHVYNSPKPDRPPDGYPGWPLWFAALAFVHVRRFGTLLLVGLAAQLVGEAVLSA